jgi:hypothetical protein
MKRALLGFVSLVVVVGQFAACSASNNGSRSPGSSSDGGATTTDAEAGNGEAASSTDAWVDGAADGATDATAPDAGDVQLSTTLNASAVETGSDGDAATATGVAEDSNGESLLGYDAGTCNASDDTATAIQTTLAVTNPQAALGGTIVSGTYHVVSNTAYTSDPNCCYLDDVNCAGGVGSSGTLVITATSANAGIIEVADHNCIGVPSCTKSCYTTSGTTIAILPLSELSFDPDCAPMVGDASLPRFSYTATASQFIMFQPDGCASASDVCSVIAVQVAMKQ